MKLTVAERAVILRALHYADSEWLGAERNLGVIAASAEDAWAISPEAAARKLRQIRRRRAILARAIEKLTKP